MLASNELIMRTWIDIYWKDMRNWIQDCYEDIDVCVECRHKELCDKAWETVKEFRQQVIEPD